MKPSRAEPSRNEARGFVSLQEWKNCNAERTRAGEVTLAHGFAVYIALAENGCVYYDAEKDLQSALRADFFKGIRLEEGVRAPSEVLYVKAKGLGRNEKKHFYQNFSGEKLESKNARSIIDRPQTLLSVAVYTSRVEALFALGMVNRIAATHGIEAAKTFLCRGGEVAVSTSVMSDVLCKGHPESSEPYSQMLASLQKEQEMKAERQRLAMEQAQVDAVVNPRRPVSKQWSQ